jgi:type VI secretion system protein ImpG
VDLLCTNRDLPLRLRPGEVCRPTRDIPSTLRFRDLGAMSAPAPTLIEGDGRWRFFAHLVSGLHAFRDRDALRTLLQLYHPVARFSQAAQQKLAALLAAIAHVTAQPDLCAVGRPPAVMRGTRVSLALHEDRFAHRGELILFSSALDHFLAESAAVNSYTQLIVRGLDHDIALAWPARLGTQGLL